MTKMDKDRVPTKSLLAYSSINITTAIFESPMPMIIIAFYAQHTSISLTSMATILLLSKIIDAFTDPLTGYLSDNTKSRFGKRKPWILAGGILGAPVVYLLFSPPGNAGGLYFFLAINAYYIFRTLIYIPMTAWSTELSRDYNERTRIASYNTIILLIAQLFLMMLPILVSSPILPLFESSEFSPEMMSFIGKIGLVIMPLFVILAFIFAPVGKHIINNKKSSSFKEILNAFKNNKPMWFFITASLISFVGFALFMGIAFIAMESYLKIGDKLPIFLLLVTIAQIISIPLWEKIIERFGKHQIVSISLIIQGIIYPMLFFLKPGPDVFIPFLIIGTVSSLFQTPIPIAFTAMLGDIIDYDILKTNANHAGTYFSIYSLIMKGGGALGGSIGLFLLAYFNYDTKGGINTPESEFGLLFTMTIIPLILMVISGIIFWFYPLNATRHAIIKKRIETRIIKTDVEDTN